MRKMTALVLLGVFCTLAWGAGGQFGGGVGLESDPLLIEDAADLSAVNNKPFAHYKLVNDIDLTGYNFNRAVISPDLDSSTSYSGKGFSGSLDGNGHTISNLFVSGHHYVGLIGGAGNFRSSVVIKNLTLQNVNVQASGRHVGALLGIGHPNAHVINCHVESGFVLGGEVMGGLVGKLWDSSISRCSSHASVASSQSDSEQYGGLVGFLNYGSASECYADAPIFGFEYCGGLIGESFASDIENCYSTGTVTGSSIGGASINIGGLLGVRTGYVGEHQGLVENCYSTGVPTGDAGVGGLFGFSPSSATAPNVSCFWNTDTSGTTVGCGSGLVAGITGISNVLMAQQNTFSGWDFSTIWQMDSGYYNRPLLQNNPATPYYNVSILAGEHGSVNPVGANWFAGGTDLTVTATPDNGYFIDQWYINTVPAQNGGLTYDLGQIWTDLAIVVTFESSAVPSCNVAVAAGPNGSVNPSGSVATPQGTELTFTAEPLNGYTVDRWDLNGSVYQYGGETFTLYGTQTQTSSLTLDVYFEPVIYTMSIEPGVPLGNGDVRMGTHGVISPTGYIPVQEGNDLLIQAYPDSGYEVYAWYVDGVLCNYGQETYDLQDAARAMSIGVLFANTAFAGGAGIAQDPYQVHDAASLMEVGQDLAAQYVLINDIDLSNEGILNHTVVDSDSSTPFLGVFDGNGYSIIDMQLDSSENNAGLISYLGSDNGLQGQVRNLVLTRPTVSSSGSTVGAVCGLNAGLVEKCRVADADIQGVERAAALVGYNAGGTIRYCSALGSVSGAYRLGLLTGNSYQGTIEDCYVDGTIVVEGSGSCGGIVGDTNSSTIINCHSTCSITGDSSNLGGFCGWTQNTTYSGCAYNSDAYDAAIGGGTGATVDSQSAETLRTLAYWQTMPWDFVGTDTDGDEEIWRLCENSVHLPRLWYEYEPSDIVCGDGVDLADFAVVSDSWLTNSLDAGWYELADINGDDIVDMEDAIELAANWLVGK